MTPSEIITAYCCTTQFNVKLKSKTNHSFPHQRWQVKQDHGISHQSEPSSWLPWVFGSSLAPWRRCGRQRLDHLLQEVHHALLQLQTLDLEEVLLVHGSTHLPARLLYGSARPLLLLQHGLHHPQLLLLHGQVPARMPFPGWNRMGAGEQRKGQTVVKFVNMRHIFSKPEANCILKVCLTLDHLNKLPVKS